MDIKDWILIGGGILLVSVVAHGFWLAWKNRRDTLQLAIDPNIPHDEVDDLVLLRGELPNGGARIATEPSQGDLVLEAESPVVVEPTVGSEPPPDPALEPSRDSEFRLEPDVLRSEPRVDVEPIERAVIDEPALRSQAPSTGPSSGRASGRPAKATPKDADAEGAAEIIIINVLARDGRTFPGDGVMDAFLRNGLKFGDMNIFHRIDSVTKQVQYSVASATEPGTFDLSAMADFSTQGVTMFLRLPGPDEPLVAFDDMLEVARDIASSLGGDLKDEQQSVMTGQTSEHCRQRIAEFSRKRMSQRA